MTDVRIEGGNAYFNVAGTDFVLEPYKHSWTLYRRRVTEAGKPATADERYFANLSQVAERLGEEVMRGQPTLADGIVAVRELAEALRGIGSQLGIPAEPYFR